MFKRTHLEKKTREAEMPTFIQYKDHICRKKRCYKGKIYLCFIIRWPTILEITRFNYIFSHLVMASSHSSLSLHNSLQKDSFCNVKTH